MCRGAGGAVGTSLQNRQAGNYFGFGSPYLIEDFRKRKRGCRVGISDVAQIPRRAHCSGNSSARKIAVTIPGVNLKAEFGMELQANRWRCSDGCARRSATSTAFSVIEKAISDKAFRSDAAWLSRKVSVRTFGKLSYDARRRDSSGDNVRHRVADESRGDDAGAKLAEVIRRSLDLDAKIERYLPEWASGPNSEWRHRVTVRHC